MTRRRPLVIIGAAGVGRETADIAEASGLSDQIIGVLDDSPSPANLERLSDRGLSFLGGLTPWLETAPPSLFAIGIAAPWVRRALVSRLTARGHEPVTLIHPTALIGTRVSIGEGSIIYAGANLTTNIRLGPFAMVAGNVSIGHDTTWGETVSANPGATIGGECRVEAGCLIGSGANVLQNLHLGPGCVIGAGAVVTKDVPAGAVAIGVPARWNVSDRSSTIHP